MEEPKQKRKRVFVRWVLHPTQDTIEEETQIEGLTKGLTSVGKSNAQTQLDYKCERCGFQLRIFKNYTPYKVRVKEDRPTHSCRDNQPPYISLKLPDGFSDSLRDVLLQYKVTFGGEVPSTTIFNCTKETYEAMKRRKDNMLPKLKQGGTPEEDITWYTDGKRQQIVISDSQDDNILKLLEDDTFQGLTSQLLKILLETFPKYSDNKLKGLVLLNTKKGALRQQWHNDWVESTAINKFFFLVPYGDRTQQNLYFYENGCNNRVMLFKDTVFVGRANLVHAGDTTEGTRLHGLFVPSGSSELKSQDALTSFHPDPAYPGFDLCRNGNPSDLN